MSPVILHPALTQGIQGVGHFIIVSLTLIFGLSVEMLFHGLLEFILVHASIGIDVVGCGIGTDFEFLEKLGFYLLSEDLAVVFGGLEIDAADKLLALHLTHFFFLYFIIYGSNYFSISWTDCSFSL